VFAILSYTAYPTSNQKNPDRKEPIAFLQTDPEVKYLIDNGSWVSNDVVHLEFVTRLLPPSAMLYLDYIPKTEPQDSLNYSTYLFGSVDTIPNVVEFMFEGAISNRWVFYTTYTPGPNVHTNGVAVAEFIKAKKYDNVAVPKRSTIWENGERVYPSPYTGWSAVGGCSEHTDCCVRSNLNTGVVTHNPIVISDEERVDIMPRYNLKGE
jgi:hypothetical protein